MPDIMVLFACLSQCVEPTPLRQLGRVIEAMLSMSGRVTMRGLTRWSAKGGSYRTIQRFFNASLNWCHPCRGSTSASSPRPTGGSASRRREAVVRRPRRKRGAVTVPR